MSLPEIYVQDESTNSTGTYKDRRSAYIVDLAEKEGVSTLCLITSGNAGYSLATYARPKGIRVVAIVDRGMTETIRRSLEAACDAVIECDLAKKVLTSEDVIALSRVHENEILWDVTNGFSAAYEPIIDDLKDRHLDYLICPVGSGEAFVGLYQGVKKLGLDTRLVGVGVESYPSFADKLCAYWTPYAEEIRQILSEGHFLYRLDEEEVSKAYEMYKGRYPSEPSSTVVWAGLEKLNPGLDKKVGIVNSGRGLN